MLDRVIIARRQSPDWAALSRDWRNGVAIDPARFVPAHDIPDFPGDIAELIGRWNTLCRLDFFTCRAVLKAIAEATLAAVAGGIVTPCASLPETLATVRDQRFMLVFCDDDDWFAPDLLATLSRATQSRATQSRATQSGAGQHDADVVVFPFIRLGAESCTFLNPDYPPPAMLRPWRGFSQRYHTNNYALRAHLCTPEHLRAMQDHFDASAHADRAGLRDQHVGAVIGATNKTPCAASFLRATVASAEDFRRHVNAAVHRLRATAPPADHHWMRPPLLATIRLFEQC